MKKILNVMFFYLVLSVVWEMALVVIFETTGIMTAGGTSGIAVRPFGLVIHTHMLVLGFLVFGIVALLEKLCNISHGRYFPAFFAVYNTGLLISLTVMIYRSICEIFDNLTVNDMFAKTVGTGGHIIITVGLFLFFFCFKTAMNSDN